MIFLNRIRRKRAAFCRHQSVRPVLECLEDRCLLSGGFLQINLASDLPGLAAETDPNLVNPWGIAFSRTGPFWVTDNGTGVSDIVDGNGKPFSLAGNIPSAVLPGDAPTGVVFNGGPGFVLSQDGVVAPSRFLFANEDGRKTHARSRLRSRPAASTANRSAVRTLGFRGMGGLYRTRLG